MCPVRGILVHPAAQGILLVTLGRGNRPWMECPFVDRSMDFFCDWMWIFKTRKQTARWCAAGLKTTVSNEFTIAATVSHSGLDGGNSSGSCTRWIGCCAIPVRAAETTSWSLLCWRLKDQGS